MNCAARVSSRRANMTDKEIYIFSGVCFLKTGKIYGVLQEEVFGVVLSEP